MRARDLGKSYGRGKRTTQVLDGLNLDVLAGECFGLVGESGSGKSTLARIVCGIRPPDEGSVEVEGREVPTRSRDIRSSGFFRKVQLVFQDTYGTLNPFRSVRENLNEALENARTPRESRDTILARSADQVGFPRSKIDEKPRSLSGGLRQRACIARALLLEPKLLVLDEPVANLDLSVQARIINLLAELRAELSLTYLLISHDLDVLEHLSDRIGVLHGGKIVEQGPVISMISDAKHPYARQLFSSYSRSHRWAEEDE